MDEAASAVTGEARVRLFRGSCAVVGRRAPRSLYDHALATYEQGDAYQHGAAAGFIHVWSLGTKTWAAATAETPTWLTSKHDRSTVVGPASGWARPGDPGVFGLTRGRSPAAAA